MWVLYLALMLWAVEPGMALRPHAPQVGSLHLTYSSDISAAAHGSRASPFHVSVLSTCLSVAFSVNPSL